MRSGGRAVFQGNVAWHEAEYRYDGPVRLPLLTNTLDEEVSAVRVEVPLLHEDRRPVTLDVAYLITLAVRAESLGPGAHMFCRVYYDDADIYSEEAFTYRDTAKTDYANPAGFQRIGIYGINLSSLAEEKLTLEFGLSGSGEVAFHDPQLVSVHGIDSLYRGRREIRRHGHFTGVQQVAVVEVDVWIRMLGPVELHTRRTARQVQIH